MTKNAMVFLSLTTILVLSNYLIVVAASEESKTLVFQGATVTANLKEAPLKTVFEKVEKETGIWFKVAESELDERVSIQFENLSVKEGLKRILRTMNYSFLFDQDNNLIGAFLFGKTNRQRKTTYPSDLNERMLKASMEGNTAAVVELLAKGADVNAKGEYSGWTPLILASKKGEIELVNYLLSYGADVNVESGVRGRTAIMAAARNRKVEAVKALLTADADLDAVDWEGYTVLMFAAISGQRDIVDVLLTHGADVNVKNKVGSSALMMASGYPNVLKKLKEAGAEE
jgi:ankyrin repeat protein